MQRWRLLLPLAALVVLLLSGIALGQTGDGVSPSLSPDYNLSWWTVDGGGYTFSQGGNYKLGGTIGQPDAGTMSDGDGGYTLSGGFWGGIEYFFHVFLPLILKNYGP